MEKQPTLLTYVWFIIGVPLMMAGAAGTLMAVEKGGVSPAEVFIAGVLCLIAGRIWY